MQFPAIFAATVVFMTSVSLAETLECVSHETFPKGGGRDVEFALDVQDDKITAIRYSGLSYSGKEGGAYGCEMQAKRGDALSDWSEENGVVTIVVRSEYSDEHAPESSLDISLEKKGFLATLAVYPSAFCGFGAEFPSRIERTAKGKCKVTFD